MINPRLIESWPPPTRELLLLPLPRGDAVPPVFVAASTLRRATPLSVRVDVHRGAAGFAHYIKPYDYYDVTATTLLLRLRV